MREETNPQKTLTKQANLASILGKSKQLSLHRYIATPHSPRYLRIVMQDKKKKTLSFLGAVCVFGYQKKAIHQSECGRVLSVFHMC